MKHNHYKRDVSHLNTIDVYRIIELFGVTCPVAQRVLKKSLAAGQRGHKDLRKYWQDIMDSAERRLQMLDEDAMPSDFGQQHTIEPAAVDAEKLERWKGAPEWAEWTVQDANGDWWWYEMKPALMVLIWDSAFGSSSRRAKTTSKPKDFAATLEPRPCAN